MTDFRLLDGDGGGDGGDAGGGGDGTGDISDAPTTSPTLGGTDEPDVGSVGSLLIAIGAIVAILFLWLLCKRWQLRRERHRLQIQSSRADAVLGDMQMVPADDDYDDDDDPELL